MFGMLLSCGRNHTFDHYEPKIFALSGHIHRTILAWKPGKGVLKDDWVTRRYMCGLVPGLFWLMAEPKVVLLFASAQIVTYLQRLLVLVSVCITNRWSSQLADAGGSYDVMALLEDTACDVWLEICCCCSWVLPAYILLKEHQINMIGCIW